MFFFFADTKLVDEIYELTGSLYSRLQEARGNVQLIMASVRRWSREPIHQRSIYGKNLLEMRHQKERLRTRLLQCEETKLLLNRLLIENFYLFFHENKKKTNMPDKNLQEVSRSIKTVFKPFPKLCILFELTFTCY